MARYQIAGLQVEMAPAYPLLQRQAAAYEQPSDQPPDMTLTISDRRMAQKRHDFPHFSCEDCEYFFWGSDFYTPLLDYRGCMIHASAVMVDGQAYLFSAPCGTGKSTHTGLWRQYMGDRAVILNDDKPAVRQQDGQLWVYGTPFSGKSDLNVNRRAPLKAICMLAQGSENVIRRLSPGEAIPLLMQQTVRPASADRMGSLLMRLDEILRAVPVFHMACTISEDAVRTSYEAMSGQPYDRVKAR